MLSITFFKKNFNQISRKLIKNIHIEKVNMRNKKAMQTAHLRAIHLIIFISYKLLMNNYGTEKLI